MYIIWQICSFRLWNVPLGNSAFTGSGIFVKYEDLCETNVGAPIWKLYDQIKQDGTHSTYQVGRD